MVANTGVPMKVDTGLFIALAIERHSTDGPRTEYKTRHGVSYIAIKKK